MNISKDKFQEVSDKIANDLTEKQKTSLKTFLADNSGNLSQIDFLMAVIDECNHFAIDYANGILQSFLEVSE